MAFSRLLSSAATMLGMVPGAPAASTSATAQFVSPLKLLDLPDEMLELILCFATQTPSTSNTLDDQEAAMIQLGTLRQVCKRFDQLAAKEVCMTLARQWYPSQALQLQDAMRLPPQYNLPVVLRSTVQYQQLSLTLADQQAQLAKLLADCNAVCNTALGPLMAAGNMVLHCMGGSSFLVGIVTGSSLSHSFQMMGARLLSLNQGFNQASDAAWNAMAALVKDGPGVAYMMIEGQVAPDMVENLRKHSLFADTQASQSSASSIPERQSAGYLV